MRSFPFRRRWCLKDNISRFQPNPQPILDRFFIFLCFDQWGRFNWLHYVANFSHISWKYRGKTDYRLLLNQNMCHGTTATLPSWRNWGRPKWIYKTINSLLLQFVLLHVSLTPATWAWGVWQWCRQTHRCWGMVINAFSFSLIYT